MKVLVTGGAGYIGSHTVRALMNAGHPTVVLDNLSTGHRAAVDPRAHFIQGELNDFDFISQILRKHSIEAVLHFAASIEVSESVVDPLKYYRNNFAATLTLLEAMRASDCKKLVFSSTAAVYGNPHTVPIDENHEKRPINPYGRSKFMMEMAIEDCARAWGLGACILRYFNVAGASADAKIGEAHDPETHLIPRVLLSLLLSESGHVDIYGNDYPTSDGTCVRDYIHVEDVADAHVLALKRITASQVHAYNLGSAKGFSVAEVVEACRKVTGRNLLAEVKARRAGDPAVLLASHRRATEELGWTPKYLHLETIIRHAWAWHSSHPSGYDD